MRLRFDLTLITNVVGFVRHFKNTRLFPKVCSLFFLAQKLCEFSHYEGLLGVKQYSIVKLSPEHV